MSRNKFINPYFFVAKSFFFKKSYVTVVWIVKLQISSYSKHLTELNRVEPSPELTFLWYQEMILIN